MTARKKEGFPVSPFLKVPTLIATNTLRPPGKLALTSAQAGRSFPASICSPHSVSCQTTPAFGPMTSLNQFAKGRLGSASSRSEADISCVEDIACFSKELVCPATEPQSHRDKETRRQGD